MRLIPCKKEAIERYGYNKSGNLTLLETFAESDLDCAEIEGFTQKSASTCCASLQNSIERYHFNGMKAITRSGKVYLIKTDK